MGNCFSAGNDEGDGLRVVYNISVKTSDAFSHAGTDSSVSVNLIGQNGNVCTGYLKLSHFLKHDFQRNQTDNFHVTAKDVGLPIVVRIKLHNSHKDDEWLCDRIVVSIGDDHSNKVTFPVYDWVVDEMQVTRGEAMLPQKVTNKYVSSVREQEVNQNKTIFEWIPLPIKGTIGWGFPRYVNAHSYSELPPIFRRHSIRQKHYVGSILQSGIDLVITLLEDQIEPIINLDSYHRLYSHDKLKNQDANYLKGWNTDESFGRQVLTGINPLVVLRCTSIPSHFNVTNDDVSKCLGDGKSLEEEMSAGKIYIVDFMDMLTGVERNSTADGDPLYCANAAGLFHVNCEGKFLPIAIQLEPNNRDYLFTPDDNTSDWLLAKMYFRGASSVVHEWVYHYLLTHSIVEPFAVSLFRCFPRSHPLFKLMRPHLRTVSAMNTDARIILIPPSSAPQKVLAVSASALGAKEYEKMTFDDLIIPKRLKKQGTENTDLLPNYHYRDNAMMLWKAMEDYVTNVIHHYYNDNKEVEEDFELQGWAEDVAKNGLGWQDNNTRGMPEKIVTLDKLIEICVTVMFTSSAQHASVNFGQFETYKFAPNSPVGMRMPPHKKGEANAERILKSLPNAFQAVANIALAHTLSEFAPDEVFLGDYHEQLFTEDAVLDMQQEFKNKLAEASLKMKERNEGLEHKYTFLLPKNVPNSIAI